MNINAQRAKIIEDTLVPLIDAAYKAGQATDNEEAQDDLLEAHGFTRGAIWALITRSHA